MPHKADKRFLIDYQYAGTTWCLDIWADDHDDAMRKLRAAAANGVCVGEIHLSIKLPTWTERVLRWFGIERK